MGLADILSLPKGSVLKKEEYEKLVDKIPLNPIATKEIIASLKKVPEGETPLDLIFCVKYKASKNDRIYSSKAYKSIVEQIVNSDVFIPVCYGHQDKENVGWEGRKIVGSCIGAYLNEEDGCVYYRIIPDASKENEDIRRWLRNKQLGAVSIWGFSDSVENNEGIEEVVGFKLLSVDFVPPLTEGQDNLGLVIGENHNRINSNPINNKEANMPEEKMKIEDVANDALQGEMLRRLKDGRISLKTIAGEMKCHVLTGEEVELEEKEKDKLKAELESLLEKAKNLGFKTVDELFDFASDSLKKFENEKLRGEFNSLKEAVMTEKGLMKDGKPVGVLGNIVYKYAPIKQGMKKEEIVSIIEEILKDKDITGQVEGQPIELAGEMLDDQKEKQIEVFEI